MKTLSLLALALFIVPTAFAATETKDFDLAGLTSATIVNSSGHVSITTTSGSRAIVKTTKRHFSDACEVTTARQGQTLHVELTRKGHDLLDFASDCEVDFAIELPKKVDLDLTVGSGNIETKGTDGQLVYKSGSGSITADGTFANVDGKSGSGRVTIKGVTGSGDATPVSHPFL